MIKINGMTWNHTRGLLPLQAAAQVFHENHPEVDIVWNKRSLQAFADAPLNTMSHDYDLLIIDHPHVGMAAATREILPLSEHLPAGFLSDLENNSVGKSYESYIFDGQLWALPVDAATPVSQFRLDLFKKFNCDLPQTWEDVIGLAEQGKVVMPGVSVNSLMDFYMFCLALGGNLFDNGKVVEDEIGLRALAEIKRITELIPEWCREADPIKIYQYLAKSKNEFYCPSAYGYSTYSMKGYAENLVHSGNLVKYGDRRLRSVLGGTGLAVSSHCKNLEVVLDYIQLAASELFQKTIYVSAGGQPGHRKAWEADYCNRLTADYFKDTLLALDEAYVRPRYNRYIDFQDQAGDLVSENRWQGRDDRDVLESMNKIYSETFSHE